MSPVTATGLAPEPEWYRNAIIYELHLRAYADSDGDGIGDLNGLTSKLDYLQELGVTAVWVLPFYPSPNRDGGYDIADYRRISPAYGDVRAFRRMLREAHARGLRVITELVLNHTSDQHPWFQRARHAPEGSRWRDFYVWSDTPDRYAGARIIFKDFETSNWTWDPVAGAYYWHRFYSHQPDLNYENPEVQDEMLAVVDHWLDMGVDGLRLDAVPYLFEREGTNCENLVETHDYLKRLRKHIDSRYRDRLILAEANQWPEDAAAYFGDGDECHMNFHFPLMPRLFMALRQETRLPIIDILEQTPELPKGCEWATFLRNHDELTLEMVTDEERDYMYRSYAADPQMRLNLGIRRRLAPLLGNDRRKIELLNALLFSLPGTPVIYYGDEIGMGDNVYLGDRDGVRTPMQWSPDRNAGFSRTSAQRLYLPPVNDGPHHYETVNVEHQRLDPNSLLSWMRQMIAVRKRHRVLGAGDITYADPDNHHVLAYVRHLDGEHPLLVVANLSQRAQSVELDLRAYDGALPIEVFGGTEFPTVKDWPYPITLGPYGYFWFELTPGLLDGDLETAWSPPTFEAEWPALLNGRARRITAAVAAWMQQRRWFAGKSHVVRDVRIVDVAPVPGTTPDHPMRVCAVRVEYAETDADPDTYVVPLTVLDGERARTLATFRPDGIVATLADGRLIVDALHDEQSVLDLAQGMSGGRARGPLQAEPYRELRTALRRTAEHHVRLLSVEQSNSSLVVDDAVLVKVMRRLIGGLNPDLEISRHLRSVGFGKGATLLGSMSWPRNGEPDTIALAYEYVPNEGDAWAHALDLVDRFLQTAATGELGEQPPPTPAVLTGLDGHQQLVLGQAGPEFVLLGRRTAQLHQALADSDNPDFAPEPFTAHYQRSLYAGLRTQLRATLSQLRRVGRHLDDMTSELAARVLAGQDRLLEHLAPLRDVRIHAERIRTHGDFHLGQVLYTGRDFVIIDFEGEPARPIGERRIKRPALRDVAGMLRSFDYAALVGLHGRRQRGLLPPSDEAVARQWAHWWRDAAGAAFVLGYRDVAEVWGNNLLPDHHQTAALLDVMLMEKALYELRYELDNRPTWAHLPLAVLAERADG